MSSFLSQIAHDSLSLEKSVSEFNIESVVIGIRYTSVLLSNGSCGVAYTLTDQSAEKNRHNKYLSEKFLFEKGLDEQAHMAGPFTVVKTSAWKKHGAYSYLSVGVEGFEEIGVWRVYFPGRIQRVFKAELVPVVIDVNRLNGEVINWGFMS